MRRVLCKFLHADGAQRVFHAPPDLLRRHAEVLGREGHVLLHHIRDDLVVGVLEHHAHAAADLEQQRFVHGVHAVDAHPAARGQQHGVEGLGERGFSAAVVAEDDGEAPALDGERHAVKRKRRLLVFLARGIGIGQVFSPQHG